MLNKRSQTQKIMYYKISHETSKKGKSQEIVDQWLPGARPRNRD